MGEEKKLFTRSFRIDEATMEKFKEISAEIGGNHQETIAKLIEAYEFQKGKQVLSGRAGSKDAVIQDLQRTACNCQTTAGECRGKSKIHDR